MHANAHLHPGESSSHVSRASEAHEACIAPIALPSSQEMHGQILRWPSTDTTLMSCAHHCKTSLWEGGAKTVVEL